MRMGSCDTDGGVGDSMGEIVGEWGIWVCFGRGGLFSKIGGDLGIACEGFQC